MSLVKKEFKFYVRSRVYRNVGRNSILIDTQCGHQTSTYVEMIPPLGPFYFPLAT